LDKVELTPANEAMILAKLFEGNPKGVVFSTLWQMGFRAQDFVQMIRNVANGIEVFQDTELDRVVESVSARLRELTAVL